MIKEFLQLFMILTEELLTNRLILENVQGLGSAKKIYSELSEEDKKVIRKVIKEISPDNVEQEIFIESFFLTEFGDFEYGKYILNNLLDCSFSPTRLSNYYFQLMRRCFILGESFSYEKRITVFERLVSTVKSQINYQLDYIPYENRNSRCIVFLIAPFLGIFHAPSRMIFNLAHFYKKLGYRVSIFTTNDVSIAKSESSYWYNPTYLYNMYEGMVSTTYSYENVEVEVFNMNITPDKMVVELSACVEYLHQLNPEYIVVSEGANVLGELCQDFTEVVYMNMVDSLPVTSSPYVIRYFTGDMPFEYKRNAELYGKKVFSMPYNNEILPQIEEETEIVLPEDKFIIVVMGNRLDMEIDSRVLEIIHKMISKYAGADWAFIGDCPKIRKSLENISERCHFLGYVEDCNRVLEKCSVFFNPKRQGGGGGSWMALKAGLPVLTLPNCDVASIVGKDFIYDSYDEFEEAIDRYVIDKDFYSLMKKKALDTYEKIEKIDSLGNIKRFTETIEKELKGC